MSKRLLAGVVLVLLLGSACGAPSGPPASSPDDPVSSTPGDEPTGRGGAQRVGTRDGLVDVRQINWDKHRERGSRAVDLFIWSGVEECYGIDHVEAEYSKRSITLTIYEGRDPEADVCIEIAVRKVIRVSLEEPIGGRRIVDGGPKG